MRQVSFVVVMRRTFVILTTALFCACSDLPTIDSFFTFNIVRTPSFTIPAEITPGVESAVDIDSTIDTSRDYGSQGTSAYLLNTSKVTRVDFEPKSALNNFEYLLLLIGPGTVAIDSLSTGVPDTVRLTGLDVTSFMRRSSYHARLLFKLRSALTAPVTITAYTTIVHTAQPNP